MSAPDALARTVDTLAQATRLAGMNDPRDLEVLRLRRRCAALECEVDALKRKEAGPEFPPSFLGLTRSQLRVLGVLHKARGEVVSLERLRLFALTDGTQGKLLHVHICHIRHALKFRCDGLAIENHHGQGYALTPQAVGLIDAERARLSGASHV